MFNIHCNQLTPPRLRIMNQNALDQCIIKKKLTQMRTINRYIIKYKHSRGDLTKYSCIRSIRMVNGDDIWVVVVEVADGFELPFYFVFLPSFKMCVSILFDDPFHLENFLNLKDPNILQRVIALL